MQLRDFQRLVGQVDADHESALLRHCLGQHAAATTDINDSLARKRSMPIDPVEPCGVDVVQRTHRAFAVPPLGRQLTKFQKLGLIDVVIHASNVTQRDAQRRQKKAPPKRG